MTDICNTHLPFGCRLGMVSAFLCTMHNHALPIGARLAQWILFVFIHAISCPTHLGSSYCRLLSSKPRQPARLSLQGAAVFCWHCLELVLSLQSQENIPYVHPPCTHFRKCHCMCYWITVFWRNFEYMSVNCLVRKHDRHLQRAFAFWLQARHGVCSLMYDARPCLAYCGASCTVNPFCVHTCDFVSHSSGF